MDPHSMLLGPPEIYNPSAESSAAQSQQQQISGESFMDLMVANFNRAQVNATVPPIMGFTENRSATYLATGNPCLDFFFHVVPDTPADTLTNRLQQAWDHNPLTTLKLICNLRGVRGTGKSDKEGYYTAAYWLHKHHPKTLACNVRSLAEFGYFKDLPEILYRFLEGSDARQKLKTEWLQTKGVKTKSRTVPSFRSGGVRKPNRKANRRVNKPASTRESRIMAEKVRAEGEKEKARKLRHQKHMAMAKKAIDRFARDPDYKFIHERISDLFADYLKSDLQSLNSGELNKISLASKWCPSLDSSFDRSTLLCERIARKIFPQELYPGYEGIEEAHYAYRVRDRLRKEVLVPLRRALELPEVYIGANQWNSLPYNRVASVAMRTYKQLFLKHDKERFTDYLERVKEGKAKIAAGGLLPHEIIAALDNSDGDEVAELQWKRMVGDLAQMGNLKNCIAICDVSGSMFGIPMEVSVALGVLVSELSDDPWKGKLITFSSNPQLHLVEGDNLRSKTDSVRQMDWGMNTNFQKVFDLILQVAVEGNLKEDQMIKRVFVFSDMEFDEASSNRWETDYMVIQRKFTEKGYGNVVPEIVFWNLRNSRATPVPGTQKGVALVSGFSKNLLKLFLEEGGILNPEATMEAAIAGAEYQDLVVLD
ncbi:hypothetical protein Nepgr_005747 [Nepenthes gracilis]|uniref:Uncharacterized protein n=1 Tax=Nepenthes gracilis TaxID=150966 RepID=A0AAD3S3R5_NEPGR|nr:hypothetical protein Nepgr_005747 [Nepenthes gracilis]